VRIQCPRISHALFALILLVALRAAVARADSLTVRTLAAGEHYRAGSVHRFLLGADYRDLWTAPVQAPVLDMHAFAGGLTPVRRVGGQQTLGLAMKGADGLAYTFRGLDKDPSEILPPEYRGTFINSLMQDQIASSFPGASVIVPPLLDAAGVLHVDPEIVAMPDDSLLGEFRPAFKNALGTIEEYPLAGENGAPGTFGATEIINAEEMWKRMEASCTDRPDARAYLCARLVDLLIGDWDRHRNQWRWARIPGQDRWQPIPEDRDQAFVRFEGLIHTLGRERLPQFVSFDEKYPDIDGLTWNGRDGDRLILVELEKPVFDEVAATLKSRITDAVIADAVARMPAAYRELEGASIEHDLRARRDQLPEEADKFYRFLAQRVDVHTSTNNDIATVTRHENGDVNVTITPREGQGAFNRTFHPDETEEVRIYLGAGNDSLVTTGPAGDIKVRAIGGDGDDTFDDRAGTKLRVSDASGENQVLRGAGTSLDTHPYTAPVRPKAPWIPPRDWGRRTYMYPVIGGNTDLGVVFLGVLRSTGYGFRKNPSADEHMVRAAYATKAGSFGGDYTGTFRFENSPMSMGLFVRLSGLDFLHFYGFGNESTSSEEDDFYKVKHTEYVFAPSLQWEHKHTTVNLHVGTKYNKTELQADHLITEVNPYGTGDFTQVGAGGGIAIDTRDTASASEGGVRVQVDGNFYPPVASVEDTFGEVHGEAALYQPIPFLKRPVLALLAGGKHVWGDVPYHEAAYIGGANTLRGFARQRFAGDASVFGSAELRVPITRVYILVPGQLGVFALGDAGRVFLDGESSDKWHSAIGGGLWVSLVDPATAMSLSVADSEEGTSVYVRLGMSF